jgi:acetaldehyde dehydrogenase (acetylating)
MFLDTTLAAVGTTVVFPVASAPVCAKENVVLVGAGDAATLKLPLKL